MSQVVIPDEDIARLLQSAGKAVLIGGQALAFWMFHYGASPDDAPEAVVTKDADFLGSRDDVKRLANAVGGTAEYPKTISILSGIIKKSISPEEEYEVDVLRKVNGLSAEEIRRRALEMTRDGARFLVMSPIDVLISRLENLRLIAAKQTPSGEWQTRTAVDMARAYIVDLLEKKADREAKHAATAILTAATHPMGINAHKRYGIDVLEALPIDKFDRSRFHSFLENEWPRQVRRIHFIRELDSQRRGGHAPGKAS